MNFDSLGGRLREARKSLGKSQDEIAVFCGVSREMWGKYERSVAIPGGEVLAKVALAGADMLYILTGIPADAQRRLAVLDRGMEIASKEADSFEDIKRVGVALSNQMNAQQQPALSQRQRALLDNYEHADEAGKTIIEGTASLAAQSKVSAKHVAKASPSGPKIKNLHGQNIQGDQTNTAPLYFGAPPPAKKSKK